ncbi:hypothetical protein ACN47A_39125 [Myxococcus fulvus]|uniref:hypothetical protein n=1 Tax=Myxococcus fulvus TaxID=33 RepID=UPI003B9A1BBE
MKRIRWSVAVLLMGLVGCGSIEEEAPADALRTQAGTLRSCTSDLNCSGYCQCRSGACVPADVIPGPPPPTIDCDAPPLRTCSTGADCITGCGCQGGVCTRNVPSSNTNCLLVPPDAFENDDTHLTASAYGAPQLKHTFHRVGDVDWILVYTPVAQVMTVQAYNVGSYQGLRVELYAYDYNNRTLGARLSSGQGPSCDPVYPQCRNVTITGNVAAQGAYVVKVTDLRTLPQGDYDTLTPGNEPRYDLRMY